MTPPYLKSARRVDLSKDLDKQPVENTSSPIIEKPSFLQGAKRVSEEKQQDYVSDEQVERDIERSQARSFSRVGEAVLGLPGDLASFVSGLLGKEQNILPTSKNLQDLSEKATGGYTAPQNEFEEKGDELMKDIGSMMTPGSNTYNIWRNIGIPIVGSLAKEGIKYMGADEKSSSYAKMGLMIGLDLMSQRQGGARKFSSELFKQADEAVPKGVKVNASGLERSLNALEQDLKKGGSRPSTPKALEKISEIKGDIQNGKIDAQKLAAYRPSINETITEMGGFDWGKVPAPIKNKIMHNLNQVKGETIKTLEQYGEKFNPEFLKLSRSANESWAAYENSNKIAKFLKQKVGYVPKSQAAQILFSYTPAAASAATTAMGPLALVGTAGTLAGYQGFKIFKRVADSPTLRKYYGNVLKGSLSGDVPLVTRNLKALDQSLSDESD